MWKGTVDFGSERNVYFDVRGRGTRDSASPRLAVNGDVSRQVAGRYRGHVVATNADAAYWTDYFKAFPQARIIAGPGRCRRDAGEAGVQARAGPAAGPVRPCRHPHMPSLPSQTRRLLALPLEDLTGTAAFTGAGVSFDAHCSAGRAAAGGRPAPSLTLPRRRSPFTASSPRWTRPGWRAPCRF